RRAAREYPRHQSRASGPARAIRSFVPEATAGLIPATFPRRNSLAPGTPPGFHLSSSPREQNRGALDGSPATADRYIAMADGEVAGGQMFRFGPRRCDGFRRVRFCCPRVTTLVTCFPSMLRVVCDSTTNDP